MRSPSVASRPHRGVEAGVEACAEAGVELVEAKAQNLATWRPLLVGWRGDADGHTLMNTYGVLSYSMKYSTWLSQMW